MIYFSFVSQVTLRNEMLYVAVGQNKHKNITVCADVYADYMFVLCTWRVCVCVSNYAKTKSQEKKKL